MTQVSRTQFKLDTATLYPDNTAGLISPADLRAQIDNIADSSPFIVTQKTSAPTSNDDSVGNGGNGSFGVGDIWIDEANQNIYVCVDDTALTAMWATVGGDLVVTRSGTTATNQIATWANGVEVQGASDFTYATGKLTINATTPVFEMDDSNATVDNQRWWTWIDGGVYKVQALTDAGIGGTSLLQVTRTGNVVGALELTTGGVVRTSLRQNSLLFSQATATIATVTNHDLVFGVNNQDRLIIDNSGKMAVNGLGAAAVSFNIGNSNLTSGEAEMKIGNARTSSGASLLEFITDPSVYPDYGLRLWKDAGANAVSQLIHRGLGNLEISTTEAANIVLSTTGQPALTIDDTQVVTVTGQLVMDTDTLQPVIIRARASDNAVDLTFRANDNTTPYEWALRSLPLVGGTFSFLHNNVPLLVLSPSGNLNAQGSSGGIYTGVGGLNAQNNFVLRSDINPTMFLRNVAELNHAAMYLERSLATVDRPGLISFNLYDPDGTDSRVVGRLPDVVANGGTLAGTQYIVTREHGDARYLQLSGGTLTGAIAAPRSINAQTGTSYTLALADLNARITMSNAAANTVAIPLNATIALPIGTEIRIIQIGAGATSIDAVPGVTLNGVSGGIGAMSGAGQYTDIIKVGTDAWWAVGDIGVVA